MQQKEYEIRFLTGAQTLYGDEALRQVDAHSQVVVDALNASGRFPVKIVYCGTAKWMKAFAPGGAVVSSTYGRSENSCLRMSS